ncbi:MacB family efflux pump subunit [Methylopila musalis]|uniref:Pyoverdine export ATP-binding/permease protein PvdT n=1 Tax=Methylopila musalis TaxID=1134781 RepID=A0ABW3Z4H1_9HYPH
MAEPLIQIRDLRKDYPSGDGVLTVLRDVSLTIEAGEMVAIMGASGSGKSTLMNILGLLDRPTAGSYRVDGRETARLAPDEAAELRRERFGFIFQRYHLLPDLTASENVEIPAIYAGAGREERQARAHDLLAGLGLAERADHRPRELSGGQQQRASIARALMNGGEIILADEPTSALDSVSGAQVLQILEDLNAQGRTVVIVTHDRAVAERARRIIEFRDGVVISDSGRSATPARAPGAPRDEPRRASRFGSLADRLRESFAMALRSMNAHRMRALLTMLGIIIGVASVVSVVALGQGSTQRVLSDISSLGTNTLEIFPGRSFGDVRSSRIQTLVVADADALARQPYVAGVTPTVSTSKPTRFGDVEASALVNGVGDQYFTVRGVKLAEGRLFDAWSVRRRDLDVVIDENTRKTLFKGFSGSPVGQIILIGTTPARVIGVTQPQQGGFGSSSNLSLYLPYTTVQARFLGSSSLRSITVRVAEDATPAIAEQAVTALLEQRHGAQDFFVLNTDDIRQTITSATNTLALLIAAIAVISLIVGGIGVMNIMLVSVSERTSEIGVRIAVGARRSDIMRQFLIEAVLVCLLGGLAGVGLALAFGVGATALGSSYAFVYSWTSIVAACVSSSVIGIVFGFVPARNAARLDPVAALSRE